MNLQLDYEFMRAARGKGDTIRKEVQPFAACNGGNVEMRNLTQSTSSDPPMTKTIDRQPFCEFVSNDPIYWRPAPAHQ